MKLQTATAIFKNLFGGMANNKSFWEPYGANWRQLKVGDYVITENIFTTSGLVIGIIEAGRFEKWKVIEVCDGFLVAKGHSGQRMSFCERLIDENDIHHIPASGFGRCAMSLKLYVYRKAGKSIFTLPNAGNKKQVGNCWYCKKPISAEESWISRSEYGDSPTSKIHHPCWLEFQCEP